MKQIDQHERRAICRKLDSIDVIIPGDHVTGFQIEICKEEPSIRVSTNKGFVIHLDRHMRSFWTMRMSDCADIQYLTRVDNNILDSIIQEIEFDRVAA